MNRSIYARGLLALAMALLAGLLAWARPAVASPLAAIAAAIAPKAGVTVPESAAMFRRYVEQAVTEVWGVDGSPARLAAQIHQESAWRQRARSHVGALGMAQFMPGTARWIAQRFPDQLGSFDPWDPRQAALAAAIYDNFLYERVRPIGETPLTECSRWAFTLRAYNGGEKYLWRDRLKAARYGRDPNDWLQVRYYRTRSIAAHRENNNYPRRILLLIEPAYIAAGWGGSPTCEVSA